MKQYLISVYEPEGALPPPEFLEPITKRVEAWDAELKAAGVWVFSGGLHSPSTATVLHRKNSDVLITDGPYVEGKEHLGGFTIIEVPDLDVALEWARKLSDAIGVLPIEVRPFREH
jgi:hypothetical protein